MKNIGEKITKALTEEQIAKLLDVVFNALDSKKVNEISKVLDSDIKETLSRLLSPEPAQKKGIQKKEIVSFERNIEKWRSLWAEWGNAVSKVGDEEGEYTYQEHHWEEPYFDGSALADDLEKVAVKMLPLIDEIYAAGIDEDDIFIHAIEEIESNMDSYPEWMPDPEEFYLEANATKCLLKWEFLAAESPVAFLKKMTKLEEQFDVTELDDNAIIDFFVSMPEKKEIYDYITANKSSSFWKKELSSTHSEWHIIYHALTESFDRGVYLTTCQKKLNENWQYGLPLIDDLLEKGDKKKAEEVIRQTFASFLEKKWNPEESLLINVRRYGYGSPNEEIVKLLEKWIVLSAPKQAISLRLQLVTYKDTYNWDAVAQVYSEVKDSEYKNMVDKLIGAWCVFIVEHTCSMDWDKKECWVNWLIETGMKETWDKKWFEKKVKEWLEQLENTDKISREQETPLLILTCDLFDMYGLKKKYPQLYGRVSTRLYGSQEGKKSRRGWLKKIESENLTPFVIECWKKKIKDIMPDPASAHKSDYTSHAEWLSAANELGVYNEILDQWKVVHKRRRNLWDAIKKKRLPL